MGSGFKSGGGEAFGPTVPSILQPQLADAASQLDQFRGMTLDPARYTMTPMQGVLQNQASSMLAPGGLVSSMQNYIQQVLNPNFANPMTNPNIAGVLSGAQDQFTQGLGKSLDMLGSQFGLMGQVPQRSGAATQAGSNLTRGALSDYGNTVSNLLMNQYNQSIGQQMQALGQSGQVSNVLSSMSGVASLPQQLAQMAQQGQIDLNQIPFSMLIQLLSSTPIASPSFSPTTPSMFSEVTGGVGNVLGGVGAVTRASK